MEEAFLGFYKQLFAFKKQKKKKEVMPSLISRWRILTEEQRQMLTKEVSREDVRRVIFSIPDDKAPGADGFNSKFYKHYWEVVGDHVIRAVIDFFQTGKLLKVINVTTLTLVQKVDCLDKVSDFRPIACYSILYKCITKLLTEKLNQVLPEIISHGDCQVQ